MDLTSPFDKKVSAVAEELNCNLHNGLSDFESQKRLLEFGPNTLPSKAKLLWFGLLLKQLKDFMILIL